MKLKTLREYVQEVGQKAVMAETGYSQPSISSLSNGEREIYVVPKKQGIDLIEVRCLTCDGPGLKRLIKGAK